MIAGSEMSACRMDVEKKTMAVAWRNWGRCIGGNYSKPGHKCGNLNCRRTHLPSTDGMEAVCSAAYAGDESEVRIVGSGLGKMSFLLSGVVWRRGDDGIGGLE